MQPCSSESLKFGVFVFEKLKKASSSVISKSYQNHMSYTMRNLIHMLLVILLSFVKFCYPSGSQCHASMWLVEGSGAHWVIGRPA